MSRALLSLLAAVLALNALPHATAQQPQYADENAPGMKELRDSERQQHEDLVRNSPPLRLGLYDLLESTPGTPPIDTSGHQLCQLKDMGFFFFPKLSRNSGGLGKDGMRFDSKKLAEGRFLATTQVITPRYGLSIARHDITLQGPASFTDQVTMTEGKHRPTHYTIQGRWTAECPR